MHPISELPSSASLASTDVLAKDTGSETQKITGADLASQIKSLGNLLGKGDVVNNLTSTATNVPLSAAQGKALNDAHPIKSYNYAVAGGGTISITCFAALVAGIQNTSNVSNVNGGISMYWYLNGVLRENKIGGHSSFSATYSDGVLTITNAVSVYQRFFVFYI